MSMIHPTAIIDPQAKIGRDVAIGAYSVVGAGVRLGDGVKLASHVVIEGDTDIDDGCQIYPFAAIGQPPQDLKYQGEASRIVIGAHCKIREHVTIHPGTAGDKMVTTLGSHCLLMVGAHVAHDCILGNHVIMANNATLAGHVEVGDYAMIGGLSAVHQFVRIGHHAMIGGMSGIEHDVIPYGSAMGERAHLHGLNLIGLKRRGFTRESIHALRNAYKMLFESAKGTLTEKMEKVREIYGHDEAVMDMLGFLSADSHRSFLVPAKGQ